MTNRDHQHVLGLFEEALGLSESGREDFLDRECAADALLRAAVERLLEADSRPHPLLDRTPAPVTEALERREEPGAVLGHYSVEREIGRGGMGVVYRARRDDVDMQVALKLLAARYASPELVARFDRERRILASLEHPYIARFLDTGVTRDGSPWLALEYVDGLPILEWCDHRRLGVPERLAVFEKVAEAVAYAHRRLLVHRDIKPSNVLVTESGDPKLLDFGIAEILEEQTPGDEEASGRRRGAPMTPGFAAPEQLRGEAVTTGTDIYQLGLLLHLLLIGRGPSTADGEALSGLARMRDAVPRLASQGVEETDPRPGSDPLEGPGQRAERRGTTPERLRRQLEGDLDAIVAAALRPDPSERYASVSQMLEDLRRFRVDLPILARPHSLGYRARKFGRRHRGATVMAAILGGVVVLSASVLAVQAGRLAEERDQAREVASALETLVRAADPSTGDGAAGPRGTVEEMAERARAGLSDDPETWARILMAVGQVYRNRGEPGAAMEVWEEALAATDPVLAPSNPVVLGLLGWLGSTAVEIGDLDEGLGYLERSVAHVRALPPDRRSDLADALVDLGFGYQVQGRSDRAEALYREAFGVLETLPDSGGDNFDRASVNLAFLIRGQGRMEEAETLFRATVARRATRGGMNSSSVLNAQEALASTLLARGRTEEAADLSARVLEARQTRFEAPHQDIAASLVLEAAVRNEEGRPVESEQLAREAIEMTEVVYGDRSLRLPFARVVLGTALRNQGRTDEAVRTHARALDEYRALAGLEHPFTMAATAELAESEREAGLDARARDRFESVVDLLAERRPGSPALAVYFAGWGETLARTDRCDDAAAPLSRAIALARPGRASHVAAVERARATAAACGLSLR